MNNVYSTFRDGEYELAEDKTVEWEYSEDQLLQIKLDEAYAEAMNKRRDALMFKASDAYEKAMYGE